MSLSKVARACQRKTLKEISRIWKEDRQGIKKKETEREREGEKDDP